MVSVSSHTRILLIDDDEDDFIVLRDHLREARTRHIDLVWASSLDEGREKSKAGDFSVYLIDYRLGAQTGLQLMQEFQARGDRTPVILLTGYGDQEIDQEAMRLGAFDYLVKGELSPQLLERSIRYSIHRAQLQSQAVEQDRMASIGLLASSLAHEIGTPLGVIRGRAELLEMQLPQADEPLRSNVRVIITQIDRVAGLIRSLLNLARGDDDSEHGETSTNQAVRDVLQLMSHDLRKHGITVDDQVSDGPETRVLASSEKLHQIVLNLVVNAIHAIESAKKLGRLDGHRIAIRSSLGPRGDRATFVVEDTGCGIPKENLAHLFRPFFTTKDIGLGTGLGLATAKRFVESWGGSISVESQIGVGTKFRVELPRA